MDFSDLTSEAMKELVSSFNTNQYSGLLKFLENKFREDLITLSKEQGHTLTKCQIEMGVSDFMKDAHKALCDLLKSDECEEKKVEQEEEEEEGDLVTFYFFSGPDNESYLCHCNVPVSKLEEEIKRNKEILAENKKGKWVVEEENLTVKWGKDPIKVVSFHFVEKE